MSEMVTCSCGRTFPNSERNCHLKEFHHKEKEMKFKVGDRVKVANIEDVGTVVTNCRQTDQVFVRWDNYKDVFLRSLWYPAYQVRLAEEEQKYKVVGCSDACCGEHQKLLRLSRKEIRKELKKLSKEPGEISTQIVAIRNLMQYSPRKEIRKELRQLSAEAFCVDKVLAERIDQLADGV